MSTIRILLGIFCLAVIGRNDEYGGGVLVQRILTNEQTRLPDGQGLKNKEFGADSAMVRKGILVIAISQIGVREATGNNDGAQVEAFLKVINLPKGNPWCAAFVSWVFKQAAFTKPRTAWSPVLFPLARLTLTPKPADVLGIYSLKLKRIAHCGLVERRQNNWIISIEGNTNTDNSREGDGVYRKWRHIRTISKFADWVK